MKKFLVGSSFPVFMLMTGCGVTEGDKRLIDQIRGAGEFVEKYSGMPEDAAQAGRDTRMNAEVLSLNLGEPKEKKPYSPLESGSARKDAKDEHQAARGWLDILLSLAPWLAGALGAGGGVITFGQKVLANKKLLAVYHGVDKVIDSFKEGKSVSDPNVIIDIMRAIASAHNVYPEIKKDLSVLRNKKEI